MADVGSFLVRALKDLRMTPHQPLLFPSSRASRSCRAPREISRSPRLAHKAPVMQVMTSPAHDQVDQPNTDGHAILDSHAIFKSTNPIEEGGQGLLHPPPRGLFYIPFFTKKVPL